MARVTVGEVKEILDDCNLTDPVIEAFIKGANVLVTKAFEDDTTLGEDLKKEIERWMTAHMIASTVERMAKKEGAGGASIEYTGQFGENLSSTPYGQTVLILDTTGLMSSLGGKTASITAIKSFD